jgi:hypothetical protein
MLFSPISCHFIPLLYSTLFSNTFHLWPSLNARDQVSHPYRTTGKITVLFLIVYVFRQERRRQTALHWMVASATSFHYSLNFFMNPILISYFHSQNIRTVPHFQRICLVSLCHDFALHSGDKTKPFFFSVFTSRPTSLLAWVEVYVLFIMVSMFSPNRFTSLA